MDFGFSKFQVGQFLSTGKSYVVPRFQREYSWGKLELETFYKDIVNQIKLNSVDNKLETTNYFLGNILLIGDLAGTAKTIEIVDGQQRITTITIMLSVLTKMFKELGEESFASKIWEFVMGRTLNNIEYPILVNDTPNPFFQYLVQGNDHTKKPRNEEEDKIKFAYEFFVKKMTKRKLVFDYKTRDNIDYEYISLLQLLRDQLLGCTIVCIWTKDSKHAQILFETLNAKGKELASIDLIKNNVLEKLDVTQPTDDAVNKWKQIIDNLNSKDIRISMSVFYRHYWNSKYKRCTESKLYDEFIKNRNAPKTKADYKDFLDNLVLNSEIYANILVPDISYFGNRTHFQYIVQILKNLSDVFNTTQTRVILLALLYQFKAGIVTNSQLKKTLLKIENFHFVYTGLSSKLPNKMERIYSEYAIKIRNARNSSDVQQYLDGFDADLNRLYPSYNEFKERFLELRFSKKYDDSNILSKYVINKIENSYANKDINHNDASIEHIIDEDANEPLTVSIGNLILLEEMINNRIPQGLSYQSKKTYYSESTYKFITNFTQNYNNFDLDNIRIRAEEMAEYYYTQVIGRII